MERIRILAQTDTDGRSVQTLFRSVPRRHLLRGHGIFLAALVPDVAIGAALERARQNDDAWRDRSLLDDDGRRPTSWDVAHNMASALAATLARTVILHPAEVMRLRVAASAYPAKPSYTSLYAGLEVALVRHVPAHVIAYTAFVEMGSFVRQTPNVPSPLQPVLPVVAGAMSAAMARAVTYPLETLAVRRMVRPEDAPAAVAARMNVFGALREAIARGGVAGVNRGVGLATAHTGLTTLAVGLIVKLVVGEEE